MSTSFGVTLGYAATNGIDVSGTVPQLVTLLAAPDPEARTMAAWALYRIGKHVGDISAAVPALRTACSDADGNVRDMAEAALKTSAALRP